jgi:hypothetical protein
LCAAASAAPAPVPDLTAGGKPDASHDWNLGPTGARGWIFGRRGQTAEARQILVTSVAKGSPADGVLQAGDVILGAGDGRFNDDARVQFARAVTASEEEKNGGVLRVLRWRSGEVRPVELRLEVLGTYSAAAPFDGPKSARVFDRACEAIARNGLGAVSIPNDLNALALLAGGKAEHRPLLAAYAQKVAALRADGFATWHYGYANIFLAEYVLATGDRSVFEGMRRMALESARGQSAVGTWGHKFAMPNGNLNGYGCMNQPGLSLAISMVLAREAGVREPEVDRAIDRAAAFLRWYVHKGAIPYGDHEPWPGHEDNGKCSSAAVLFDLLGDREAAEFFATMSAAAYSERERGHTGNFFNILWALPGVYRCGPATTAAYFREQAWYYDLARGWDGSVAYPGSPAGAEEHGKYARWDCTGAYLLAFALPRRSLYLTGKKPGVVPPLSAAQAGEVIAAGRDYFPVGGTNGYDRRTDPQLLAGLSSWSPAVRRRSAEALGRRAAPVAPELLKLLDSRHRDSRYGACDALGRLGPAADAAAPQLRALLRDPDPWMQSLAARAIPALGPEARRASVSDLLAMTVRPNPSDPRRMAQRAASIALFSPYPGSREPGGILASSLEGVDRTLLYPAIQAVLRNEDGAARGSLARIYPRLTDADVVALLPAIVTAVETLAPSNEMFGDGVRLAGLDLLSRLHIREGMALCVSLIEPERWGMGNRLPRCLEYLDRYGVHARAVLPELQEVRRAVLASARGNAQADNVKRIDAALASLGASTASPTVLRLDEFTHGTGRGP